MFSRTLIDMANEVRPDGTTRVRAVLERLADYAEEDKQGESIPAELIPSVVRVLLDIGDDLLRPEDENLQNFDFGNDVRIGRILYRLLSRLNQPQRFRTLREAIESGNAISIMVDFVADIGKEHGRLDRQPVSEEMRLVTSEQLEQLEALTAAKIREAAQHDFTHEDSLIQLPKLEQALYRWRDWGGLDEITDWFITLDNQGISDSDLSQEHTAIFERFAVTVKQESDDSGS